MRLSEFTTNSIVYGAVAAVMIAVTVAVAVGSVEGNKPAAEYPAVSVDGNNLVFVSNVDGSRDLWISDVTGANAVVLAAWPDSDETHPSWSPDGSRIVFSSTRGAATHHIWSIDRNGANARQLTFDAAEHEYPRYSPQGLSILYLSNATGKRELWVMNSDGTNQRPIALIGTRISSPAWSPNGQQIVYVGCQRGGACNLFSINADGSGGFQITSGNFQDWTPDWGTPGIIFASNRGSAQGLWLVQANGSGLRQLTTPDGTGDLDPRWVGSTGQFVFSRSGKGVADAASDIWSVSSMGALPQQVTKLVVDTTPPQLTVVLSPNVLWPPNHRLVEVRANVQVSDDLDPNPTVVLVSITSNEPDNGLGDGDTANDIQGATLGTDDRLFLLRAERSPQGGGRVYSVTYRATDATGNATLVTQTVSVPKSQGR
jgi:dipeptidyl aminopeptidase/acylaminoacyl peptidase